MTVPLLFELVLAALVVIGVAGGLLYILKRRLSAKIAALRHSVGEASPEHADDQSYNLLELARAEAATLKRTGADVHVAEAAIADGDRALRRRDFDDATRSARRAHELLVAQRSEGSPLLLASASPASRSMPTSAPGPGAAPRPNSLPDSPVAPVLGTASGDGAPVPRLAKNRAESRFQMSLLAEEIGTASNDPEGATRVPDARKGAADAQTAYDRADYTESLRLALRARRALGTRIETLPPPLTRIPPTPTPVNPASTGGPAGTEPCSTCGRPLKPTDKFCRSCGTAKAPTACAACGTPLDAGDRFCAGCGAPSA